jgi:predicted  nucleic acid-binding Zn-ribbon protein
MASRLDLSRAWYAGDVPPLSSLLDIQDLDLASDQLGVRHRTLPEREALLEAQGKRLPLDQAHAALVEGREVLNRSEHSLGVDVAGVAAKAKEVEETLYSGSVRAPKELESLQLEIGLLRERQSGIEEQELELLEEIDRTETEMAANRQTRDEIEARIGELEGAIRKAEAEIKGEQVRLAEARCAKTKGIPPEILETYDHLRTRERLGGRAAAALSEGHCGGCRIKLPVLEYTRMKAKPEDALICCVQCGRVLVR